MLLFPGDPGSPSLPGGPEILFLLISFCFNSKLLNKPGDPKGPDGAWHGH